MADVFRSRYCGLVLIQFLISLGVLGSASHSQSQVSLRKSTKAISVAFYGGIPEIDPLRSRTVHDFQIEACLFETLVNLDENSRTVSGLASAWHFKDKGKTLSFTLAEGHRFSDGSLVTTADVAYSLSRHAANTKDSAFGSYLSTYLSSFKIPANLNVVTSIHIVSPKEIELSLSMPFAPILQVLTMPSFGIISREQHLKGRLVGSGPFVIEDDTDPSSHQKVTLTQLRTNFSINKIIVSSLGSLHDLSGHSSLEEMADVYIGIPYGDLRNYQLPIGFNVTRLKSLSYAHFFLNARHKINHDLKFRTLLGRVIGRSAKETTPQDSFFSYQNFLIPRGAMPPAYYQREELEPLTERELQYVSKRISMYGLAIILPKGTFDAVFVKRLKEEFKSISPRASIEELSIPEVGHRRKLGFYDIAPFAYMGDFPDPEGFIEPLKSKNDYGLRFPDRNPLTKINRNILYQNEQTRINKIMRAIVDFEEQHYVIPLFSLTSPLLVRNKIEVLDTSYKLNTDLWKLNWKNE